MGKTKVKLKKGRNRTIGEWRKIASEGGVCEKCGKEFEELTIDHIIPITIIEQLAVDDSLIYDDERNFQFLCPPCNSFKSCRLDRTNPMTKILLQELINKI